MPEQITYYHDNLKMSAPCHRVEVALVEANASYTSHGFDIYNKPAWFAQANPFTGKVPAITYGGPNVPPEEPSHQSFKLTESYVILEFLADLFPNSTLLPPASDPRARARVRFFMDIVRRDVETPILEIARGVLGACDNMIQGLERIQTLLPDSLEGGEYAIGKDFTIADCAIAPLLAVCQLAVKTGLGGFKSDTGTDFREIMQGPKFERLRRYQTALWERESVRTVVDLDRMEGIWKIRFASK